MRKPKKNVDSKTIVPCACGKCDLLIRKYDDRGRLRTFAKNHFFKKLSFLEEQKERRKKVWLGRKHSPETIQKISEAAKGRIHTEETKRKIGMAMQNEKHWNWKGDDIGYAGVHRRVKKKFPKSELCMICKENPATELANITGIYKDENKNWVWSCHRCNLIYDNVGRRAWITRKKKYLVVINPKYQL